MNESDALQACHNLVGKQDWVKAWHATNAVLNEYPESPRALYLMGLILREQGHVGLALPVLSKALAAEQRVPNIWMNYAATLHDLGKFEDAQRTFSVVAGMLPNDPMPPANIASTYVQRGLWHDAITWANKALALDPENHIANISVAFAHLALGRWRDAWKHAAYLYGYHLVERVYNDAEHEEPRWDGSKGKTVVVQCDQGLGDIIMFAQMIPQMVEDCREVIIECAERLVPLMTRNFPACKVYGTLKKQGQSWSLNHKIDAHIHISFLGKFYRNKDADFPRVPYLKPDEKLVAKWRDWLAAHPKPWRGFAWRGGIARTLKYERSVDPQDYAAIMQRDGTNIDLSYHDSTKDVERSGMRLVKPPIDEKNYDDTIALIVALDEVYTVTTTVAHVCGALGRKASVLVPIVPAWRYAYRVDDGTGMIWYPKDSVRLYRRKPGEQDWSHAVKRMADGNH